MLQASATAHEPDPARRPAMAPANLVLHVRVPDYADLMRRAHAARAAAMMALIGHMVAGIVARLDRLKDRVSGAIGERAVSSQP